MPEISAEPKKSRSKKNKPTNGASTDAPLPGEIVQVVTLEDFALLADDKTIDIFDLCKEAPSAMWGHDLLLYLYRVEPAVANRPGDKRYITKYAQPIDEDEVKQQHGGGKYKLYLKHGTDTLREETFSIEGAPRLLEGQTIRQADGSQVIPPGAQQPQAQAGPTNITEVLKVALEAAQNKTGEEATKAAMDVIAQAARSSVELMKSNLSSQSGSPTGNHLADKLLEAAITRMNAPPEKERPTETISLMKELLGFMRSLDRQQNPAPAPAEEKPMGLLDQVELIKEITGEDSLMSLMRKATGGNPAGVNWGDVIVKCTTVLPGLFQQWAQWRQYEFLRREQAEEARLRRVAQAAVLQHQIKSGQIPPPVPETAPTPAAAPAPTATAASPGPENIDPFAGQPPFPGPAPASPEQMITQVIANCFDEGDDGDEAAYVVMRAFPDLAKLVATFDQAAIVQFVQHFVSTDPLLIDRAREAEWPKFQQEFIAELSHPPEAGTPVAEA